MRCRSDDNLNATTRTGMRRATGSLCAGEVYTRGTDLRFAGSKRATVHGSRRPAAVLIMVVAVLGILFVSGAALLTVVTFSSRSIDAAKVERENRDAVEAIERQIMEILAAGFLNDLVFDPTLPNGVPYSMPSSLVMHVPGDPFTPCSTNTDCVLSFPVQGEIPGIHLIDVTEPIENVANDERCEVRLGSNLQAALEGKSPNSPMPATMGSYITERLTSSINLPQAVQTAYGYDTGAFPLAISVNSVINGVPDDWQFYNDAVGDGVMSSIEMRLPRGIIPAELQRRIANRLRTQITNGDPDELTLTLKVVPHTSMINLNDSRVSMRRVAFGYQPIEYGGEPLNSELFGNWPYRPAANEWLLRSRGPLVPLNVQPTRMLGDMASELLEPQTLNMQMIAGGTLDANLLADPTARHWWNYDPVADTANIDSAWRLMMDPNAAPEAYDDTHNLTTISHDDLLARSFVDQASGDDAITLLKRRDQNELGNLRWDPANLPELFALDNYPAYLDGTGDPRLGRLKISLPYLDVMNNGGTNIQRVVQTLRDAFLLMLGGRQDFDANGVPDRDQANYADIQRYVAVQAAMLAANMMDYVDGDATPTAVPVVRLDGTALENADMNQVVAFGFETQPFITEITSVTYRANIADPHATQEDETVFAIELYNPYSEPIDLSEYELVDLSQTAPPMVRAQDGGALVRFGEGGNGELSGTIPGRDESGVLLALDDEQRFVSFCGYGTKLLNDIEDDGGEQIDDQAAMDGTSQIALVRNVVNYDGQPAKIVVDRFDVTGDTVAPDSDPNKDPVVGAADPNNPEFAEVSAFPMLRIGVTLQRDTTMGKWRFPVPLSVRYAADDSSVQSLGEFNAGNDFVLKLDAALMPVFPVHVETMTAGGGFANAFPTTGSMLLVGRMAHLYDPPSGSILISDHTTPFNRVHEDFVGRTPDDRVRNILGQRDQIDNGRLPVFDANVRTITGATSSNFAARDHYVLPTITSTEEGRVEGLDALPWGQLVFDYFTALPIESCPTGNMADPTCNPVYQDRVATLLPPVDQGGMRVRGRLNINTASWKAMTALPMINLDDWFGASASTFGFLQDIKDGLGGSWVTTLPEDIARGIVAYREGRGLWRFGSGYNTGNYNVERNPYKDTSQTFPLTFDNYRPRRGFGFLTVGELLNVRYPNGDGRIDGGAVTSFDPTDVIEMQNVMSDSAARYEHAIAHMVVLEDWVTTKSHVFTVYGVIRGAHAPLPADPTLDVDEMRSFQAANQSAIRFQTTVDRLPMVLGADRPTRIGGLYIGGYSDLQSE